MIYDIISNDIQYYINTTLMPALQKGLWHLLPQFYKQNFEDAINHDIQLQIISGKTNHATGEILICMYVNHTKLNIVIVRTVFFYLAGIWHIPNCYIQTVSAPLSQDTCSIQGPFPPNTLRVQYYSKN